MPTDKIEISEKAVSAIASSAERYIGYVYAGILPLVILTVENGARVKQLTESLGGVLAAISAFVLGIGIYTIYANVLGAFFLFPVQHAAHLLRRRSPRTICDRAHLTSLASQRLWCTPYAYARCIYESQE